MQRLLVLGNKRYSSWSLRAYLALKFAGLPFDEKVVPLFEEATHATIKAAAPGAPPRVPVLVENGNVVWDTASILEFAAENSVNGPLWPEDKYARAHARSISAEMHSGFVALRGHIPMNLSREDAYVALPGDVEQDVKRIFEIWTQCRQKHETEGPYLFGALSLADAIYAPVVARFRSRRVPLPEILDTYCNSVWGLPAFQEWRAAAELEPWVIEQ